MSSVLAVAANHIGLHNPRYHIIASQYKGSTLKSIRRLLAADWQTTSKSELLSTLLMLCYAEISDQCRPEWLVHMHGANAIARQPPVVQATDSDAILSGFIAPYFAAHNILAYTAVADPALEPRLVDGGRHWLSRIKRSHWEIDSSIGCSAELLSIILDITVRIRHLKRNPDLSTRTQARVWKNKTERLLRNLRQELPGNVICDRPSSSYPDVSTVKIGAEAFRQGAVLFLQYLEEDSFHEAKIQHCVDTILALMKQCPVKEHGGRSSVFWPFFLAGCHSTKEGDRAYVLDRFRLLERPKRYGNTRPARKVIEHVWKQRDLGADEPCQQKCGSRCFEWEDAMVQLGSTISLT
ncbi:hypothetical protein A1O3_02898 [Capronia epimyces CBS 606.96]|uniref:Uncharacterized protein n=1 Tax=Capronia epimyces CBS 606.96 TaxID=1182542 RepID=W9YKT2_9EURO|nr:uncharacterized protein A1O3_02898 [Capronia epimyces CBS 606.96]EXJ89831.1 hypothetical protein A1O3_02898 [Capronia epimyces CBS 606.96]